MMAEALKDGLAARNGGAISNGATLPRPKATRSWGARKAVATPVVVTLAPLWRCDASSCPKATREGQGGEGMLAHAALFHGRRGVFTDLRAGAR